ncbi:MAG: DNA-binding protein [Enterocloster sp.]
MEKMFMRVDEVMEALEVSESYVYKLIKRLNRELEAMGCQTIPGRVDRKYFYQQFYGTKSYDGRG